MYSSMQTYLVELKKELKGSDSATIQDALVDAEEHLTTALDDLRESQPDLNEADALGKIIEHYGTPEETAAAYLEVPRRRPTFNAIALALHGFPHRSRKAEIRCAVRSPSTCSDSRFLDPCRRAAPRTSPRSLAPLVSEFSR